MMVPRQQSGGMKLLLAAANGRSGDPEIDSFVAEMEQSLHELGHEVDVFRFPTIVAPAAAMEYALALGMLDLGANAHRLITVGWHCHLLRYPAKIAVIRPRDHVLELLESGMDRPAMAYTREAVARALRASRRIVVPDRSTGEQLRAWTAIEPLVGGQHLARREALEAWLD